MAEKNTVNVTISVTKEERKMLKQIALENDVSLSGLVRKWISEWYKRKKIEKNG